MGGPGWWSAAGSAISCRFAGGVPEKWCCAMSEADGTERHRAPRTCGQPGRGRLPAPRSAALLLLGAQDAAASPVHRRARHTSCASSCAAIAATENQRAGSVPGFSSVHKRSMGSQGFVRGRIRCDPAATGERGPGVVDRGISQSASRTGNKTPAHRWGSSTFRRGSSVPRGVARLSLERWPRSRWTPSVSRRQSGRLSATAMWTLSFGSRCSARSSTTSWTTQRISRRACQAS